MKILITGAAGNLGGLTADHMLQHSQATLNLLEHQTDVAKSLKQDSRVTAFRGDLADSHSLEACLEGVDVVVHYAGVLFKPNPEKFLPTTNTQYLKNLMDTAVKQGVKRMVLISFPHVEGETTRDNPATGRLDGKPNSAHASTRLEEEKYLFETAKNAPIEGVSLRVGMVYGRGILMVDTARWLAQRWLLGVWHQPTWIHLISKIDFLRCVQAATEKQNIAGIYHVGDDGHQTLQEFLQIATKRWGLKKPWSLPTGLIYFAASACELWSKLFKTKSPLTRDFITIGMQSYFGDTSKMKTDLLPRLEYETIVEGQVTL